MMSLHRIDQRLRRRPARTWRVACAGLAAALLAGCAGGPQGSAGPRNAGLAGSAWNLVSFTSSSDTTGVIKPQEAEQYQLQFSADGKAVFRFDCNRWNGTWEGDAAGAGSGSLRFGTVATTRAMCPPQAMNERLPRDIESVRSYRIDGDRLYLSLMADGGVYQWARRR
ncbi:META domain-containing protein [Pseudoduganella lutea]|uniref:META domain-containing protein n=1 Tax=Pseudoduganella lutea TaxID=321985 RepID=A0A4P6L210_9BURK|nr:META domain-containing protein [Pseudoduganella lutea]QBE65374.1 META domain-containing protein [Pseudoduganella lutea]